jgi:hypothetical protein
MTLFELQAWLGHASPETTQHYAKITPNTLTRAYRDAGYFERNVRTIDLLDRDAVTASEAASGEPWRYYDLGHGLCSYTFIERCPHRMASAKCDFCTPKDSSKDNSWRPRQACSGCSLPSRSPTTNAPLSTMAKPPWTIS